MGGGLGVGKKHDGIKKYKLAVIETVLRMQNTA